MSVVYSRRLKKELQEIQIEQADPAKRAAGASRRPPPSHAPAVHDAHSSSLDEQVFNYYKLMISRRGFFR